MVLLDVFEVAVGTHLEFLGGGVVVTAHEMVAEAAAIVKEIRG